MGTTIDTDKLRHQLELVVSGFVFGNEALASVDALVADHASAYHERDMVLSLACKLLLRLRAAMRAMSSGPGADAIDPRPQEERYAEIDEQLGLRAWLGQDPEAEDGWRNVVLLQLPSGQVSWHVNDEEAGWFATLPYTGDAWDGVTDPVEKERRLLNPGL